MSKRVKRSKRLESLAPCVVCDEPETLHMVMCDLCDGWYHFHCAGVGPDVENFAWVCLRCENEDSVELSMSNRHNACKRSESMSFRSESVLPRNESTAAQRSESMSFRKGSALPRYKSTAVQLDTTSKQIVELNKNLEELKTKLSDRIKEETETKKQIAELKQNLEDRSKEETETKKQIEELKKKLEELKSELVSSTNRFEEQGNLVEEQHTKNKEISKELTNLQKEVAEQSVMIKTQNKQIAGLLATKGGATSVKEQNDVENKAEWIVGKFLNLTCNELDRLNSFNNDLGESKLFLGLADNFCVYGGELKFFITGMLDRIMSKTLQASITWSGKRTSKTGNLKELTKIVDLIHFCCQRKFANYNTANGESIIQKILQK